MKDLLGNEVVKGDILLELGRGYGSFDKSGYKYHLKLWEKPKSDEGCGYEYSIDGTKHEYWWASVKNSIKVDPELMPEGFIFSFKHGMSEIYSKIESGTLLELIENSDWKNHEVKKEQVERFEFMKTLTINSIDDIIENIDELKSPGYLPREIMNSVLGIVGVSKTNPDFGNFKGEIGMAAYYDMIHYQAIIKAIAENPDSFKQDVSTE